MNFTKKEVAAILQGAIIMMKQGGEKPEELKCINEELVRLGIREEDKSEIYALKDELAIIADKEDWVDEYGKLVDQPKDCFTAQCQEIVQQMSDEQKKYVSGFMIAILKADGVQDDDEFNFWKIWCCWCQIPKQTPMDAYEFWRAN